VIIGGYVMKSFLFLISMFCAVTLVDSQPLPIANAANSSHTEKAVVEFQTPVKLMNVILQGEYLFVHDHEKMAAGEDCTYVYKIEAGRPVKLVISFHCIPVPRKKVDTFTMRSSLLLSWPVLYELQEYQFAGSDEGHQVPSRQEAKSATVDIMGCCE